MLLEMQGNPERPRQAFRRRTVVLFVALLASMALLWYLDWICRPCTSAPSPPCRC